MFKWLRDAKRLPQVEAELEATKERLRTEASHAQTADRIANTAAADLEKVRAELDKVRAQTRKQNEADLLLLSLQIVQRITAGDKKETSAQLNSMLAQQAALMQNVYPYGLGQYGASGGGALGSLLGGAGAALWPH